MGSRGGLVEMDAAAWRAVLHRDRSHDGAFVFVARTTGIYCRPSCPARRPHLRNAALVESPVEAERLGYVACRRCHPDHPAPAEKSIQAALAHIETHLSRPITLASLSRVSGFSPNHLHRAFRRIVGISPKAFCDIRRLSRFRDGLRAGASISDACYDAGFGSSRALYERSTRHLGMTPAVYQRGGAGTLIRHADVRSRLGCVVVAGTGAGICAVLVGDDAQSVTAQLREEFHSADFARYAVAPEGWSTAVASSEREDPCLARLMPRLRVAIFQTRVWRNLSVRNG